MADETTPDTAAETPAALLAAAVATLPGVTAARVDLGDEVVVDQDVGSQRAHGLLKQLGVEPVSVPGFRREH